MLYTSLILSHHHSHIHTYFFISLSKKKTILKEVKKREEDYLYFLFLSHYTHTDASHFYLSWKKHKNIIKGHKKKEKAEGTSMLVSFSFDLFFLIFIILFKS